MVKKIKGLITWRKDAPLKMAGFAHGTVTAMTGNTNFATPAVGLTIMDKAALRVENAWANRKNGQLGKDELDTSSTALDTMLHTQCDYVSNIANGNATIIHSAGFETSRSAKLARGVKPENAVAPVATPGTGGSMKVKVDVVPNAKVYCFILVVGTSFNVTALNGQLQIPNGNDTYVLYSTKHTANFINLPTLKNVQIAVVTMNTTGASDISPVTTAATNI